MKDEEKTREQLLDELNQMRSRLAKLEEMDEQRNRTEDALRATVETFRALMETAGDRVWEVDKTGVYTYASPQTRDLLGYGPEEVLGRKPFDFMLSAERKRVARIFHEAVQAKAPIQSMLNTSIHKSGRKVELETTAVPIADVDGNLLGYRGIDRNITKQKLAEAALLESEKRFSVLMEHLPVGVFIKDRMGRFVFANRYLEELFSWRECVGKTTEELLPREAAERMSSDDRKVLAEGPMVIQGNFTDSRGAERSFETYQFPIEVEGSPALLAGITVDIAGRRLAEVQAIQVNALKEQLIGRGALNEKLRLITEATVQTYGADFARIWITREGDLCAKGCAHAQAAQGPHGCRDRSRCLHLVASSGRYTHLNGNHRRVPLGAYKIGRTASGRDTCFLTNDVLHDPSVHNHEWAEALALVSFAGFRLISADGDPIGVLALFKKQPIAPEEMRSLEDLANTASQVIRAGVAEEALRESENRFRSLVMNSSDTITVLAADGTIRYQSPSLKRFFGYEPEDMVGKQAFAYVHPDDQATTQAAFSRILDHPGTSVSLEYRFRHANGTWIFVESMGSSFLDDPGIGGVVMNSRDISERKRAEEALEKRIVALTQPLEAVENIALEDLFNLSDLQRLQDLFAGAWGVAALITRPDGAPVTQPSNFTYFCSEYIRKNEKGQRNCHVSDAMLGRHNPSGPIIQKCMSAGLWGAGASITIGGRHIANWLIGQVRNEAQSEEQMLAYAREIGADETAFREAYRRVPTMSQEKFEQIAHALFALSFQLSTTAYQNIQQARFIAERKKTEQALHESQQMLQSVLDTIPVRVFWKDLESTYLGCNRAFAVDAGLQSPEEIVGKNDSEMIWAKQAALYRTDDRLVMETGKPKLGYEELATLANQTIWMLTNKVPLLDAGGRIKGILGTYQDITKSKQMEEELRASETRYRIVADNTYDWEYWESPEGRFLYTSPSCQRITGYQASEFEADPKLFSRIVHADDLPQFQAHLKGDRSKSSSGGLEFRIIHRDGTTRWIGHLCQSVFDDQGRLMGRRGSNRDITERKLAEGALRTTSLYARSLIEASLDPLVTISPEGKITDVNRATEQVTGVLREHLIGDDFSNYFTEPEKARSGYQKVLGDGWVRDYPLTIRHTSGETTDVLYNATVYRNEAGEMQGVFAAARDVTERKQAERALRESSEKLKLFAYSVAHDLKSPAIGIYGLTKRLNKHAKDVLDEKGKVYCDQILKVSEHIAELVDKINVYIATKEARLSIETINIADILLMLKDEFSAQLSVRQIDWLKPETKVEIKADRLCLLRVFRNFMDNSLKYGGERLSKIWTGYEESEDCHIFSFSDNGKGLKEEDAEKIFGAFQRNETSRGIEGAGLGLTIVKEIAEQHGGKVWIEPRSKKGVTFYLSISKHLV